MKRFPYCCQNKSKKMKYVKTTHNRQPKWPYDIKYTHKNTQKKQVIKTECE